MQAADEVQQTEAVQADPVEEVTEAVQADPFANLTFPVVALVAKSADKIPVTVADRSHLDRLIAEHGAGAVEVKA